MGEVLKTQRNRILMILVLAASLYGAGFMMADPASAAALAGNGTSADPYLIESLANLEEVRADVAAGNSYQGRHLQLTEDIQLPDQWEGIGTLKEGTDSPENGVNILPFSGILDGGGHTVTSAEGGQPLFGYVREATIRNLGIAGKNIEGCGLIGNYTVDRGADGTAGNGVAIADVENITIRSGTSIQGSGIVSGYAAAANTVNIVNCTAEEGVVIGCGRDQAWVGSFGGNYNGTITGCHSAATVYGTDYVGGIIGARGNSMSRTSVSNCVFTGKVIASGENAGGIAGGGYGGIRWGINTAPNAPMLSVMNCLCTGSVQAADVAGGIVGYETSLQVWENGRGYLQSNLFTGTVLTTDGTRAGGITGAFRGLDRYDIIQDNYYRAGCGASRGVGSVSYVDTSCEDHETEVGGFYFDTSKEIPVIEGVNNVFTSNLRADHNRTDDPLGQDADALAKTVTAEQLQDGTVTGFLNHAAGSLGNWEQGAFLPEPQRIAIPVSLAVKEGYRAEYGIGDELSLKDLEFDLAWSDGREETIYGDDERLTISGFDSSKRAVLLLTAAYGTVQTEFTVRILEPDSGEKMTVYFRLLGDRAHGPDADCGIHTRARGNLEEWVPQKTYQVSINCTAGDLIREALNDAGLRLAGGTNDQYGSLYISGIQVPPALLDDPEQVIYLNEKDNGENSGWMYAVNEEEPGVGVDLYFLEDGDELIMFFTDDYKQEASSQPYQEEEDRIRAQIVTDLINALPAASEVSLADETAIASARGKYEELTPDQKLLVGDAAMQHLQEAEEAIEALKGGGGEVAAGKKYVVSGSTYKVTKVASAKAGQVTLMRAKNAKKVTVPKSVKLADGKAYKVNRLAAGAFKGKRIRTAVLKTKLLTKASVRGSLKGSKIKTIKVRVGTAKMNKKYVKKYRTIFTKGNAGRKVTVK